MIVKYILECEIERQTNFAKYKAFIEGMQAGYPFHAVGYVYLPERMAVHDRAMPDVLHRVGYDKAFERIAVLESEGSQLISAVGYLKAFKCFTVREHIRKRSFDTLREHDVFKRGAAVEKTARYLGALHTVRQHRRYERGTFRKSTVAYIRHTFGDSHFGKGGTFGKGVAAYVFKR